MRWKSPGFKLGVENSGLKSPGLNSVLKSSGLKCPAIIEGQKFSVKIHQLICQPNMITEARSTIQNRLATLEDKTNANEVSNADQNSRIEINEGKIAEKTAEISAIGVTNTNQNYKIGVIKGQINHAINVAEGKDFRRQA